MPIAIICIGDWLQLKANEGCGSIAWYGLGQSLLSTNWSLLMSKGRFWYRRVIDFGMISS